jgi:hypothetical protein
MATAQDPPELRPSTPRRSSSSRLAWLIVDVLLWLVIVICVLAMLAAVGMAYAIYLIGKTLLSAVPTVPEPAPGEPVPVSSGDDSLWTALASSELWVGIGLLAVSALALTIAFTVLRHAVGVLRSRNGDG